MSKEDVIEVEGVVREAMPNKVTMEMSPYDLTKARITWRSK